MTEQEKLIAMAGGKTVLLHRDNGATVEEVKVRQISVRSFHDMMKLMGREPELLAAVCDRPPEWIDTLTAAQYEELLQASREVNTDFFKAWVQRHLALDDMFNLGVLEKAQAAASAASKKPAEAFPT